MRKGKQIANNLIYSSIESQIDIYAEDNVEKEMIGGIFIINLDK